jgi:hypothetical protein
MAGFRFFVLSLCGMCACVGLVNSEERVGEAVAEPLPENLVVFGGVEVCGPIYDALLYLGPKDEFGRLDPEQIKRSPHLSRLFRAEFPPPAHLKIEFAGFAPTSIELGDFKEKTQTVTAYWDLGVEDGKAVWADMNDELREANGEPAGENDVSVTWEAGRLGTTVYLNAETGMADISYYCIPTEDEFWARFESVPDLEDLADASEDPAVQKALERRLGRSLLAILSQHGEPTVRPFRPEAGVTGLYYEDEDFNGVPCHLWFWFVNGETIYRGAEFALAYGPELATKGFWAFSRGLGRHFGRPFVTIGGNDFDRIKNRWLNGVEEVILRLEMADDPPWYRFEIIDRENIHKLEGELRPRRKQLPKFSLPARDSGKTRRALVPGTARG